MSDLLNQASLVMVPSGYKEDTVYSVVPSDGSGDLSFTRASNGTRINSAGLVEVTPWNLLEQSETFATSPWNKSAGTTLTSGQTDPNGGTTAFRMQMSSASNYISSGIFTVVSGSIYTYTIYIKSNTGSSQSFRIVDGVRGVAGGVLNGTATTSWQRFEVQITPNSTSGAFQLDNTGGTYSNDLLIAFSQANLGSTAKPYFPTTDRLNVPRLTYQNGGGGCPSLLLEKQSTNLALYSEDFDNASWIKLNGTSASNVAVSPDGTQNADSFIPNTTSGIHALRSNLFNQSATASHSWFVKANGYTKIAVRESELVGNYATFNLTTGTLISTNQTGSIQNLGNGWYRCTLVDTTTGVNAQTSILVLPDSYTSGDPIVVNWSGDGTKGVFAWGAQVELSSYPTSYIPTTSASATRVADACSKTGISSLIGGGTGTWFMDFEMVTTGSGLAFAFNLSDGTTTNHLFLYWADSSSSWAWGGSDTTITLPATLRKKVAVKFSSGTGKLFCNGSLISTLSLSTAFSRLDIGQRFSNTFPMDGKINQAYFLTTSLTDAECQAITTI